MLAIKREKAKDICPVLLPDAQNDFHVKEYQTKILWSDYSI